MPLGTSSSVPQDYSAIAHLVGGHVDSGSATDDAFGDNEQPYCRRPIPTVPVGCIGAAPARTSETTPLLAPPVPRIVEDVDGKSFRAIFWEEVKTLLIYSFPVFGSVIGSDLGPFPPLNGLQNVHIRLQHDDHFCNCCRAHLHYCASSSFSGLHDSQRHRIQYHPGNG